MLQFVIIFNFCLKIYTQEIDRDHLFYTSIPDDIKQTAVARYPWNATKKTPVFTGLPPHMVIMSKMEEMKVQMAGMRKGIADDTRAEFDKRRFGTSISFETKKLIQ